MKILTIRSHLNHRLGTCTSGSMVFQFYEGMKKSFYLFNDQLSIVDKLTVEQQAELLRAIRDYNIGKEPILSPLMDMIFHPFRVQFERDIEAYDKKVVEAIEREKRKKKQ